MYQSVVNVVFGAAAILGSLLGVYNTGRADRLDHRLALLEAHATDLASIRSAVQQLQGFEMARQRRDEAESLRRKQEAIEAREKIENGMRRKGGL